MSDRLERARRAFGDIELVANAEFCAAIRESDQRWNEAAAAAIAAKTTVPPDVVETLRTDIIRARTALARALSPARAELFYALAEARENGTFHFGTAPSEGVRDA